MVGHRIDHDGIRPLQYQYEAITKNIPKKEIELQPFLGVIQHLSKYTENLSAKTDLLRKLFEKQNKTIGPEQKTIQRGSMLKN